METYLQCLHCIWRWRRIISSGIKLADRKTHIHVILPCEPFAALGASKPFLFTGQHTHFESCKALTKCLNPLNVVLTRFFARPSFTFVDRPSDGLLLLNPVDVRTARDGKLSAIGTRLIGSVVIRGRWSD